MSSDLEEIIQAINDRLGLPSNVISIASTFFTNVALAEVTTGLTFVSLFVTLLAYYHKHRSLDSIKIEELEKEKARLQIENDEKMNSLKILYESRDRIKKELEKKSGIEKTILERRLNETERNIKLLESQIEINLDRIDFINTLIKIIEYKKFLKEKGIWNKIEDLKKKIEKELNNFDIAMLKHQEVREVLRNFDIESAFLVKMNE